MVLARMADRLLDFCFPRRCPGCDRGHERSGLFCPACERLMQDLETMPECRHCGRPIPMPDAPCPLCRGRGLKPFTRTLSLGVFREPARSVIHQVKYRGRWELAEAMADRLVDAHDLQSWLSESDALVPVPLHSRRQVARGFNQADVIARQIGRRCGLPVLTPAVRGRRLVVVDDVSTTGATLASFGRTLRAARPADLSAVVLCVADPRGRDFAYV